MLQVDDSAVCKDEDIEQNIHDMYNELMWHVWDDFKVRPISRPW